MISLLANVFSSAWRHLHISCILYLNLSAQVPPVANKFVGLNITQPLLNATGQVRWAINNIVEPISPPCTPLAQDIYSNPAWISEHLAAPGFVGDRDPFVEVCVPTFCAILKVVFLLWAQGSLW